MWTLLLVGPLAQAAGFGGADLMFVGELDTVGVEFLVDLKLRPLLIDLGTTHMVWVPVHVSWGIAPAEDRLDRLQVAALSGARVFSSGTTAATFKVGEARWEQEDDTFDLTFGEGGIALGFLEQQLTVFVGGGLRLRYLDAPFSEDWAVQLGVPIEAEYFLPLPNSLYAVGAVGLRPSVGLAGTAPFTFEADGHLEAGYQVVAEEDLGVRILTNYNMRYDSWTTLDLSLEHRLNLGAEVAF